MIDKFELFMRQIGLWIGFVLAAAAIYGAGPFPFIDQGLRLGGAIGSAVVITLSLKPLAKEFGGSSEFRRLFLWLIDIVILFGFIFTLFNFAEVYESLWDGVIILEAPTLAIGFFGTLVIIEMVRRAFGIILPIICIVMLVYAQFGDLPGIFGHRGFTFEEVVEVSWFSFSGVFGRPTDIVSSIVLVFIVFGAVLEATGATTILLKMATTATARIRGGTAHSAIVASALFGTISGSPVANVVGTGVFTIPMIKRQGFTNAFAGAVEAAASSGGQFTPPIMAAVAFIMAELIGVPYLQIAIAAAIPALFYYFSLFASVYAEAVRLGIEPLEEDQIPVLTKDDWIEAARFIVPLVVVVAVLFAGRSAAMAGFSAIVAAIVTGIGIDLIYVEKRQHIGAYGKQLVDALQKGGAQCAQIMVAVGSIGIVIAVVSLTGIAGNFGTLVAELAEGSLFAALAVTAIACLILGMGLPTLPAYLFIVLFVGPVIGQLGIPVLLVHMFVLYFGVLSNVTPPVAIAAYAAAPIAQSNPMSTGFQAIKISAVGFIIPFILIYYPSISIVIGFDWGPFMWILVRMPVAVWLVATAFIGCDQHTLPAYERILRTAAAVAMLIVDPTLQIGGLVVGVGLIALHRIRAKNKTAVTEAGQ
ncbi:MAG TPA: TRAP transporter fused permease subunit [Rhodospirillales bacterium]|jgi:TRAP transporter 4TM/12TM fusion protein|nr:TRAP transporter fused permease subunit [Rhodospirillales bacterium]MDP7623652.1 TRAP transporter fused permease subunit [Rhodospirillales bacterium]HJO87149.1 TRAP transporter fused permease subunit [Rhodospirillales bacterium]